MAFNISDFRANGLIYGGARASQFQVIMPTPLQSISENKITYNCRAAQLPPSFIDEIPVPYFGRNIKVAGDRTFPDWSVQINNDEDFPIRALMERWHNEINTLISNRRGSLFGTGNLEGYKTDAIVQQMGKDGNVIREYTFYGMWPVSIEGIDLAWDAQNVIETFGVTFAYDWWVPTNQNGSPDTYTPFSAGDSTSG